jgi:hypothetical protein
MEQPPRVALGPDLVKAIGQLDGVAVNRTLEVVLDAARDRGRIAQLHGRVEPRDQM